MSMIKIVPPGSQIFDVPVTNLVKVANHQIRGNDLADFVKRAGHQFADALKKMEFKDGDIPIHLIALGDGEHFGANHNFDRFGKAACIKYHDTFVKRAKFYRNHCFKAKTLVLMADLTRKPIEEVVVGDKVWTTEGPRRVTQTFCNPYDGLGVKIKVKRLETPFISTSAHPVLSFTGANLECTLENGNADETHSHNCVRTHEQNQCPQCNQITQSVKPVYIPADQLAPDDFLASPALDAAHSRLKEHAGATPIILDGVRALPVDYIELIAIKENVYNLEVEEVHQFVAGEIIVHNCNTNPAKSYGYVKLSMYNEPMGRIELLAILNGTKEAAKRNGGLVADEEMEKLARDEDIAVSMACKVPWDQCFQGCGNKARNRSEYCDAVESGGQCKYGGLKYNLGRIADDGHVNTADNIICDWFDISKVKKPADRTAYVFGKAASGQIKGGAELAEELGLFADDPFNTYNPSKTLALVDKLAHIESVVGRTASAYNLAFTPEAFECIPHYKSAEGLMEDPFSARDELAALAMQKIALPFDHFICCLLGERGHAALVKAADAVYPLLQGIYSKLRAETNLLPMISSNPYGVDLRRMPSQAGRQWAEKRASDFSLEYGAVQTRINRAIINGAKVSFNLGNVSKIASSTSAGQEAALRLAEQYALYKLAFLQAVEVTDPSFDLTCELAIRQNYVNPTKRYC